MNFKGIVKKYAKYALCAAALSGGVIASSALSNNKVSALESTDQVLVMSGISKTSFSENFIGDIINTNKYSWITSEADLNTIALNLNLIEFDVASTHYSEAIVYANIDDIDNFDFNKDGWVMTYSDTVTSSQIENTMVLITCSSNILERMKEDGFSSRLEDVLLKCLYGIMLDKPDEPMSIREDSSNVFLYGLIGSKNNGDGTYMPLGEQFIEFRNDMDGNDKIGCFEDVSEWTFSVDTSIKTYDELINGSSSGGSSEGVYTEEDLNKRYEQGLEDGKNSVDITIDNEEEYNRGLTEGKASVDITVDNQDYTDQYIQDNNYHSDEEYLAYGEEQRQIGIDSVDTSIDNQEAINNYIDENKLKTEIQYKEYGKKQFEAGAGSVDITSNDKEVYEKGFSDGAESIDVTIDNEEIYDDAYNKGYKDNKFLKQVGRLFGNIGSLFVNAWTGVKGWFR